ncbi:MAG: hypothetical protein GTN78_00590 [Gemmatimonadales bacterium]|nr:hypothetical protein [Gemmatimonadales bacterium]NIN10036.1 hypothetical protein [Gemmatimonadales bacterium]NIQ98689.1 hypothetical protein [Gemmatimonadales bacterium]NIS63565.1 hypothetical protein [Gemmatimonadales bacterium]
MNIEDLKPADILVFSGEKGSLVSEIIMLLTGAPVSHAAMVFREPQEIVEETPPAVAVHKAVERFQGRKIYVNRLVSGPTDIGPVLDAAQSYVNEEEPYAMSNLYLVGLLLVYQRFTPNTLTKRVMIRILKKLTAKILHRIHEHETPGKQPMVCSQFVYQCFEDAGGPYHLDLRDALLAMRPLMVSAEGGPASEDESTLDRVMRRVEEEGSPQLEERLLRASVQPASTAPDESEEELLAELRDALQSVEAPVSPEPEDDVIAVISRFAQAVHATHPESGPEVRLMATRGGVSLPALRFLHSQQAVFVTPADLLDGCKNLTRIGTIDI